MKDSVQANVPSDPYLFSGYPHRALWLQHGEAEPVIFTLEVDLQGRNEWTKLREIEVPARSTRFVDFTPAESGAWVRLFTNRNCSCATALFQARGEDSRTAQSAKIFDGIATPGQESVSGGLLRTLGGDKRTLGFATTDAYYELNPDLSLRLSQDAMAAQKLRQDMAIPKGVLIADSASALYVDEKGRRWRLPKGDSFFEDSKVVGNGRVDREVVTERDLFNCHGTFYELPAESSGGFGKIRPIATHNRHIQDYASFRGLLVLSGIAADAKGAHIVRSDDGKGALWVGAIDDLWQLGKPRGKGGPWMDSPVKAGEPSDPYLATGYDRKRLMLHHSSSQPVGFRLEADLTGNGDWCEFTTFKVKPGETLEYTFPDAFGAYWLRVVTDSDTTATAQFSYE